MNLIREQNKIIKLFIVLIAATFVISASGCGKDVPPPAPVQKPKKAAVAPKSVEPKQVFDVRFGALKKVNGAWDIAEETTTIPLKTRDTGYVHGVVFIPSTNAPFKAYTIVYPPNKPDGIRTPELSGAGGYGVFDITFDPGDPAGKYKLVLYINNQPYKTIEYDVIGIEKVYVYDPVGKRDPFVPLLRVSRSMIEGEYPVTGTLESYDISDFKLIAVLKKAGAKYYGLLLSPDNKSFAITEGDVLGLHKGKVKKITSNKVIVQEFIKDYKGELRPRKIVLELRKGEGI